MINFINFISTPSTTQHNKINRWYLFSCGTMVTLLVSLSIITAHQIMQWQNLDHTHKQQLPLYTKAQELTAQHSALSKEKTEILKKTEDWEKYTHHAKKPSDILKAIQKNTEPNQLTSLRMVHRSVHFQVQVQSTKEGITIAHNMQSTTIFDQVKLTSFKPNDNDTIEATIEGKIKKA